MAYEWNFGPVLAQYPLWVAGAVNTAKLIAAALCFALPVGFVMGIVRQQRVPVLAKLAVVYIDFFRTSVALVLVCWCYFALPVLLGVEVDVFVAVTLALGLQASAFVAEIVRNGIESIAPGQWEAARALGMSGARTLRKVVLPQAVRRMLPVFFLLVVEVAKNSALAGVVTYNELFYNASNISSSTYRPLETFTVVGLIYFVLLFAGSRLSGWVERRLARADAGAA